jgi:hypothetical protein
MPSRFLKYFLPALLMLLMFERASAALDVNTALKLAGSQRVMSQSLLKSYCQIGQEIRFLAAREELQQSIARFDSSIADLKDYPGGEAVSAALSEVEASWAAYKEALQGKASKEGATLLEGLADNTHAATSKLVEAIEAGEKLSFEHIFDLANEQATMTQRAAAQYLLASWGLNPEKHRARFIAAIEDFDSNQIELATAPENNQATAKAMASLSRKWALLKDGHRIEQGEFLPGFVVRICDSAREMLEEATESFLQAAPAPDPE